MVSLNNLFRLVFSPLLSNVSHFTSIQFKSVTSVGSSSVPRVALHVSVSGGVASIGCDGHASVLI